MRERGWIVIAVLVIGVLWSWRPPTTVEGRSPTVLVAPADSSAAWELATVLFRDFGFAIDTVASLPNGRLLIVPMGQAFVRTPQFNGKNCHMFAEADSAIWRFGREAYQRYGKARRVSGVEIHLAFVGASKGGWFWRTSCGGGSRMTFLSAAQLDSL